MSAIKSNNLVVPVAPLNITKDNGYAVEQNCWAHYDFASKSFANLSGSGAALSPKSPNFLFKNGELRQVAKNDFTIESDIDDTTDYSYALVFKVYSSNTFNNNLMLFGFLPYGIGVGGGVAATITNSNGTNQLYIRGAYGTNFVACDLVVGVPYFVFLQRKTSTTTVSVKIIRMTDDTVMYNNANAGNVVEVGSAYKLGIGQTKYININANTDFGMSELLIWKNLQYANAAEIYNRAKSRNLIKGYI